MLNTETLLHIEAHCRREPLPAIRGWRELLERSLDGLPADEREHAAALLLKLQHIERSESVATAQDEVYLAPELLLEAA